MSKPKFIIAFILTVAMAFITLQSLDMLVTSTVSLARLRNTVGERTAVLIILHLGSLVAFFVAILSGFMIRARPIIFGAVLAMLNGIMQLAVTPEIGVSLIGFWSVNIMVLIFAGVGAWLAVRCTSALQWQPPAPLYWVIPICLLVSLAALAAGVAHT